MMQLSSRGALGYLKVQIRVGIVTQTMAIEADMEAIHEQAHSWARKKTN